MAHRTSLVVELAQRYFTCKHCGAHGEVAFTGVAVDSEHQIAEVDLRADAMRTQALIACPSCGRRAPGATRWVAIRIGFWLALGVALTVAGGTEVALGAIGCSGLAVWQAGRERGRFGRARRALILKLAPGPPVEPPRPVIHRQLAPPPELPLARVVSVAAVRAPSEPDPTAPPRFLGDPDKAR